MGKKENSKLSENIEQKLAKQTKDIDQKFKDQTEEIKRSNDVLYEKFRDDIKIIGEGWSATDKKVDKLSKKLDYDNTKIGRISVKLDATFNIVGEMKEDIEIIKMDISFIKNALKQKADKDELEALEKRVLFLENKFKRI